MRSIRKKAALVVLGLSLSTQLLGQDGANDRAEREAEQMVSLSASTITDLLLREPGLMLAVKKMLVRRAYEQGRLLDPADITDEALFRMLREDANVRVLATREIEDRSYVRVKPSHEELRQDGSWRIVATDAAPAEGKSAAKPESSATLSQEKQYWSSHEQVHVPQSGIEPIAPDETQPSSTPSQPAPLMPTVPPDYRRQQGLAGLDLQNLEPQNRDSLNSLPLDSVSLPRVSLPGLLNASIADGAGSSPFPGQPNGNLYSGRTAKAASPNSLLTPSWNVDSSRVMNRNSGMASEIGHSNTLLPEAERDQPVIRRQPNPYADVPSLLDLYEQVSKRSSALERFGMNIFQSGTGNFDELPMDMPVGPDYVLGPGDGLNIEISGSVSGRLQRVVDRQGLLALPEAASVQVAGQTLGEVQHLVQATLRTQYRDARADVSLARLRTVRVYVVGDAVRPGAYDVSSLSTPLNALYLAGGPTIRGSLRVLRHYRGNQLVESMDVYDLLLHGVRKEVQRLEAGDTVQVPPLGTEVAIEGMVRRPAIYELNGETQLAEILELAGGVLTSGTLRHIEVERVIAHQSRTMLQLDLPEANTQDEINRALEEFRIQDSDKIRISPILPYSEKTVYLDGHVFHPGKYAFREGMRLQDLIPSFSDLLPEPALRHAEIIRLNPPDFAPVVLAFDLADAMAGKGEAIALKPFDTIRIFGRFDFEDPPMITVSGEVRRPGDRITNGRTNLRDAIYLAGGTTPEALLSDAQVFRKTQNGKLKVISVDLSKALAGDSPDNIELEPADRVFIHKNLAKLDPPTVKIEGEVARPGKYPLGENMTAAELVHLSGGLKRGAYTASADLTRYAVEHGANMTGEHATIPLARALAGEPDADVRLHDGDVLTVRQLAGWNDVGATITVKGEVLHAGEYGIQEGERLSSILERAGGLRGDAYPYGAILERAQIRDLEERNRSQLIREVEDEGVALKAIPGTDQEDKMVKEASLLQWKSTMEKLENAPPVGRLVIHISKDVKRWANTPADVTVQSGDVLYIPKQPGMVTIEGAVYNPTAVAFKPGKTAGWYLGQAGGPTNMANKGAIFVIRADGSVVGGAGGLFQGGAEKAELRPGDMVVVPEKAFAGTTKWKNILQTSQLLQAVAFSIQLGRSF